MPARHKDKRKMRQPAKSANAESISAESPSDMRRISWLKRIGFSLIPAIVLFGSAEAALRLLKMPKEKYVAHQFAFPSDDMYATAFDRDSSRFWRLHNGYNGPWTMYKPMYTCEQNDPNVNVHARMLDFPNREYFGTVTWQVNSRGFRGKAPDPDKRTILFLGDSVTFGWGVRAEDCFVGLIQQRLKSEGYGDYDVINAGVPGYSSYQCLVYLREILKQIRPDVIIVETGINDGVWALGPSDRDVTVPLHESSLNKLARQSNLVQWLAYTFKRRSKPTGDAAENAEPFFHTSMFKPGQSRVPEEDFKAIIAEFAATGGRLDAPIYFCFAGLYNEYCQQKLVKSVRFTDSREIDIVAAMNASGQDLPEFFLPYDEAHFSQRGHRFAADLIWERLQRDQVLQAAK